MLTLWLILFASFVALLGAAFAVSQHVRRASATAAAPAPTAALPETFERPAASTPAPASSPADLPLACPPAKSLTRSARSVAGLAGRRRRLRRITQYGKGR